MDLRSFGHRTAAPEITIDEGEAVLIAARVVQQASSAIEIVWDFVRHIPDTPAQDKEDRQGYLVGWRDGDARYEVIVAAYFHLTGGARRGAARRPSRGSGFGTFGDMCSVPETASEASATEVTVSPSADHKDPHKSRPGRRGLSDYRVR